jgi:hypothetical protein
MTLVLLKKQSAIISLVEKQVKIVPLHYYRNDVDGLRICFGIPLGVAFVLCFKEHGTFRYRITNRYGDWYIGWD